MHTNYDAEVRCTGDVPRCANCQENGSQCVYEPARQDRLKEAMDLNASLVTLLKNLSMHMDEDDQQIIRATLEDVEDDLVSVTPAKSVKSDGKRPRSVSDAGDEPESEHHGEALVTTSVGSNGSVEFLGENLMRNREAMETGYIVQNSEIRWLRSIQQQSELSNDPYDQHFGPPGASRHAAEQRAEALHERRQHATPGSLDHVSVSVTDVTFYLDSDDLQVDIAVDPYEIPEPHIAERLFDCYMETVHSTFPLIPANFEDQFRQYITSIKNARALRIPDQWRATMPDLYDARRASIRIEEYSHDHFRAESEFGPSCHVSRAWSMIGLSIRFALALGLHLRNEDPTLDDTKRERLVQTWWCLHSIECLVCSITGRPSVIASEDCTISLPKIANRTTDRTESDARHWSRRRTDYNASRFNTNPEEGPSSTTESRYFLYHVNVKFISQRVLYVQNKIKELLTDLEEWAKVALPAATNMSDPTRRITHSRDRLLLRTSYLSAKILITRPCLCRIERRISGQSSSSINFNARSADACVEAARELATLFPDRPESAFIYSQGPWWDIVHIIMQSLAVLLLDMTYRGKKAKGKEPDPHIDCIKKLIRWLRAMATHDAVAKRAYHVIWKILKTCAPVLQSQANELLAEDVETNNQHHPRMYTPDDVPHGQQHNGLWRKGEQASNAFGQPQPPTFENATFSSQVTSSMQESEFSPYSFFSQDQTQLPMTFGNPFTTGFDQGAPIINMQDLWEQRSAFNEGVNLREAGYFQQDQPFDPHLQGY
ncbi:hypothetical protein T440DRAFT_484375 [Plenodomus tracheiphilus IPT5]|uniref:Xylanolytic transcriptional activator regulatory domain-containing protein n=1 Tax=Plenodomus tracheiphilus IPT5 TaxID=1408161 RepID=A0A6A7APH7_9PLEO|nr:hypothetical protein T440DRAFT_484375 [Plenodomus tracheiphilus IPT5]